MTLAPFRRSNQMALDEQQEEKSRADCNRDDLGRQALVRSRLEALGEDIENHEAA